MTAEPRRQLDLWSLLDVYRCTFEILHAAALQWPHAVAAEAARLMRA